MSTREDVSSADLAEQALQRTIVNDLAKFAQTLGIARRTRRIIWTNFAGTLGVDAIGIVLAAFGLLNPLFAAFIHVASELTFILNSARLLPSRAREERLTVAASAPATVAAS